VLSPGAPVLPAGGCGNAIIKSGIASKFPPSWIGLLSARLGRLRSGTRMSQSPADLCAPPTRAARRQRNCSRRRMVAACQSLLIERELGGPGSLFRVSSVELGRLFPGSLAPGQVQVRIRGDPRAPSRPLLGNPACFATNGTGSPSHVTRSAGRMFPVRREVSVFLFAGWEPHSRLRETNSLLVSRPISVQVEPHSCSCPSVI
jgi:hypothetical protein